MIQQLIQAQNRAVHLSDESINLDSPVQLIAYVNEIDEGQAQEIVDYYTDQLVAGKLTGIEKKWTTYQRRLHDCLTMTESEDPELRRMFSFELGETMGDYHDVQHGISNIGMWKWLYVQYQIDKLLDGIGYLPEDKLEAARKKFFSLAVKRSPSIFAPNSIIDDRIEPDNGVTLNYILHYTYKDKTVMLGYSDETGIVGFDMEAWNPARYVIIERLQSQHGLRIRIGKTFTRRNMAHDSAYLYATMWEMS